MGEAAVKELTRSECISQFRARKEPRIKKSGKPADPQLAHPRSADGMCMRPAEERKGTVEKPRKSKQTSPSKVACLGDSNQWIGNLRGGVGRTKIVSDVQLKHCFGPYMSRGMLTVLGIAAQFAVWGVLLDGIPHEFGKSPVSPPSTCIWLNFG